MHKPNIALLSPSRVRILPPQLVLYADMLLHDRILSGGGFALMTPHCRLFL